MQDNLETGRRWHRSGHLHEAARLYQAVLEREPGNADALHLLGLVALQTNQPAPAVELLTRAIAVRPGEAAFHGNLAGAYRALGQLDRAADCCRQALLLQPGSADL